MISNWTKKPQQTTSNRKKTSALPYYLLPLMLIFSMTGLANARDVEISWNPSSESNLAGYKVYYKESGQNSYTAVGAYEGASPVDVGNAVNKFLTGILDTKTYCFAVTAYDGSGKESEYSNEVCSSATAAKAPQGAIEAELCFLSSPMEIVSDTGASSGAGIQSTTNEAGTATYSFNIPSPGAYKIVARVFASGSGADSFYVDIDGQGEGTWDLNPSGAAGEYNVWREDDVTSRGAGTFNNPQFSPYTTDLTKGSHTITFRGRESSTKLDYFYFVRTGEISTTNNDVDLDG
jgi:hypothetical protein